MMINFVILTQMNSQEVRYSNCKKQNLSTMILNGFLLLVDVYVTPLIPWRRVGNVPDSFNMVCQSFLISGAYYSSHLTFLVTLLAKGG